MMANLDDLIEALHTELLRDTERDVARMRAMIPRVVRDCPELLGQWMETIRMLEAEG